MAQTTRLASFGPFSLFVGLRWLLWAFVGLHGCRPRQRGGVVGVVQPAKLYSKKKTQPPAYVTWRVARVGLLTRVCTGRGYCQAYPHPYPPVPVPVTLGVWPDPCLSLTPKSSKATKVYMCYDFK